MTVRRYSKAAIYSILVIALARGKIITCQCKFLFMFDLFFSCSVAVLLNGSLLYDYGRLSDCFVQNGRFLVAFLCERSFFVKIWKITKGGPLDKFSPKHKEISVFTSQS